MKDDENTQLPPLSLGRSLWAIRREMLPQLARATRIAGTGGGLERLAGRVADAAPKAARRGGNTQAAGQVAVIPLTGVITPRGSLLSLIFGGSFGGLQGFREEFRAALASPDVGAIVLDVDSPGGLVDLVPETAQEIREARGDKPIVAVANTMAASAAYYIAAQADELVVTPSGDVGSVGVYMLHEDWSGWNEQAGINPTYISAGKYKTEGNMDEPLSEEAQAAWQVDVDDLYTMFVDDVAAGRDITSDLVRAQYGEGRCLLAARSLAAGMVDRIDTLETVVGEFLGSSPAGGGPSARRITAPTPRAEDPTPPANELPVPDPAAPTPEPDADPAPNVPPASDPPEVPEPEPAPVDPPPTPGAPEDPEERAAIAAVLT